MAKICFLMGTRPEIIKISPLIHHCLQNQIDFRIIHTNQHWSPNVDKVFFEQLELPEPDYNLRVILGGGHGFQTGTMLQRIEEVFTLEDFDVLVVQGDTNTVLAGALVASKLGIKVAHVEAGLRSFDRTMPEEINRIVTDHISDYLFCPTDKQQQQLLKEGIAAEKVFVTGNTIVDAVNLTKNKLDQQLLKKHKLTPRQYLLLTMHRPGNVDQKETLETQLNNITKLAKNKQIDIICPIHHRTKSNIQKFKLAVDPCITLIDPVGYTEMICFQTNAKMVITDSGGVQEESCIVGTPTLNLRENTERPECVDVGASKIVGSDYQKLVDGYDFFENQDNHAWENPFGDGTSSQQIVGALR